MKRAGQITIVNLVTWGVGIAMAIAGSFFTQARITETKIDVIRADNTVTVQRIATVEEGLKTIKEDNKIIKEDIKELLRRVK